MTAFMNDFIPSATEKTLILLQDNEENVGRPLVGLQGTNIEKPSLPKRRDTRALPTSHFSAKTHNK